MRKALGVLILLVLTAVPALAQLPPEVAWETQALRFRSTSTAGIIDSTFATFTAGGELDTSQAISVRSRVHVGTPDSLQSLIVWAQFYAPSTGSMAGAGWDPADSIYFALDGSADNGVTWRTLTTGIGINGFREGSHIGGAASNRGNLTFNGAANSATNVLGRSPVILPTSNYGNWYGWPLLRVRTMGSAAAFAIAVQMRLFVTYPADKR